MKKSAIRKAVAKATDKHMPKVIDQVARSQAYGKVYDAMRDNAEDAKDGGVDETQEMGASPQAAPAHVGGTPADLMARAGRG